MLTSKSNGVIISGRTQKVFGMMNCKVRFAPSPTGFMHIGNARIAIINYLFCKKNRGHFLFRIDDTDSERSKTEYEEAIKRDIKWLGIEYDSTFRQSERVARYDEIKNQLIEMGLLYKCYESQEELEYKRKIAIGKGRPPVYDRASLNLSDIQKAELENSGVKPYWRFKLPQETISWDDIIMGNISYDLKNVSDPVIEKADKTYLYNFSSVIDDFDTNITHIIRGQDHTTNTAVQIALFNAISGGSYKVDFAHLSLLVNSDGSQFSKRLGSLNLADLRKQGAEPMSIANLMATLGSSLDTLPLTHMDELIDYFDVTKFSTNSPKFDINEIFSLNKKILHRYSYEDIKVKGITLEESVFNIVHENVDKLSDFDIWDKIFADNFNTSHVFSATEQKTIIEALKIIDRCGLEDLMQELKIITGLKGKDLFMPIRKALTGLEHGPNITDIMVKLGKNEVIRRLKNCCASFCE